MTRKVAPVFQGQQNTSPYAQQNTTKCFVCDELAVGSLTASITEVATTTTQTKLPNKIAKVVGDSFMVIVAHDDVICRRCLGLFNQMDKIESELERVKNSIKSFLSKKYSISDDDQPPAKLQKLNSGRSPLVVRSCILITLPIPNRSQFSSGRFHRNYLHTKNHREWKGDYRKSAEEYLWEYK